MTMCDQATLGALARGRRADFVIIGERGGDVTADPTGAALLLGQADETWVDGVRRYERDNECGDRPPHARAVAVIS